MKAYVKPVVSQIQLVMDQAVLTACKTLGAYSSNPGYDSVVGYDCDYYTVGTSTDCLQAGS